MSKPLDYFKYENGVLETEGVSLDRIADVTGTPVYIYSAEAFLTPLRELKRGLEKVDHMVCFAVKANSNLSIIKLLSQAGAGMDVVSGGELFRVRKAGVPAKQIVFSGVGKTATEMTAALEFAKNGIFSFNVESVEELSMLSEVATKLGKKASVALRFNPDVDAKTHPYISTGLKENKFGITREEVLQIVSEIGRYPGVDIAGLSIHIGSQLLDLSPLNDAFIRAKSMIEELNARLPKPLSYVDLGGGLGITYNDEKSPSIAEYCQAIVTHFGNLGIKVLIEPGRALSGNSGVLVSEVLYRKTRKEKDFLVIDAAMNDLLRPALYDSHHEIVSVHKMTDATKKADVVGPVCESGDCFAKDRSMPSELSSGDLVAILSAGAYGFTMSGNYNSRCRPAEVLVQSGSFKIIRDRETFEDLIHGEKLS